MTDLVNRIMMCIIVIEVGKHDRQCTHNVTMRRIRATIVEVEKQCILHLLSVCS